MDLSNLNDIFGKCQNKKGDPTWYKNFYSGNLEAAKILLPVYSSRMSEAKDCRGLTASDTALMEGHRNMANLIAKHANTVND